MSQNTPEALGRDQRCSRSGLLYRELVSFILKPGWLFEFQNTPRLPAVVLTRLPRLRDQ